MASYHICLQSFALVGDSKETFKASSRGGLHIYRTQGLKDSARLSFQVEGYTRGNGW